MKINLKKEVDNSYDILIGKHLLNDLYSYLKQANYTSSLIITDSKVRRLYGNEVKNGLKKQGINTELIHFKAGEESKTAETYQELSEKAFSLGLDRKSVVIALGGGVVGDIAGFLAGTYMRGIDYVQVPTTLLAMVDSSIGGKVAINLSKGKNICGLFYQPKRVLIDIDFLKTLPRSELNVGLVEMIKHGIIYDSKFFNYIERNIKRMLALDKEILVNSIRRSCEIKGEIVEKDEKEQGLRMILNYGHTLGHALEALTNYSKYRHGEAVAIGIAFAAKLSNRLGLLEEGDMNRQINLLKYIGLPTTTGEELNVKVLSAIMQQDKKVLDRKIRFVVAERIGKVRVVEEVPKEILVQVLRELSVK